jgi:hypothetical protein
MVRRKPVFCERELVEQLRLQHFRVAPAAPISSYPRLNANDRFVVFNSAHASVGTDTNGGGDVYLRVLEGNSTEIICIDTMASQSQPVGPASAPAVALHLLPRPVATRATESISIFRDRQTGTMHWVSQPSEGGFPSPSLVFILHSAPRRFIPEPPPRLAGGRSAFPTDWAARTAKMR